MMIDMTRIFFLVVRALKRRPQVLGLYHLPLLVGGVLARLGAGGDCSGSSAGISLVVSNLAAANDAGVSGGWAVDN